MKLFRYYPFSIWTVFLIFSFGLHAQEKQLHPMKKVRQWFNAEKEKSSKGFHRFASLATVSPSGVPHARMIEITGLSKKKGALFFTHSASQKVIDLTENSQAALNVWLPNTLRQICINGKVVQILESEAETSWKRMPRFMKLAFIASDHQSIIESSDILEAKKKALKKAYPNEIPMPHTFIGYRLIPDSITFYEIKPRQFPVKEIATLAENEWMVCQVEP